jgi:hypothetical protein
MGGLVATPNALWRFMKKIIQNGVTLFHWVLQKQSDHCGFLILAE